MFASGKISNSQQYHCFPETGLSHLVEQKGPGRIALWSQKLGLIDIYGIYVEDD